ncbi:hypothetical protein Bca52824_034753 [Brassica carinata]|uniref:Uncharacterized protein n=1 Tax=Brassica carinata TaxID=52824 RepID=A0A8X7V3H6_BRACI|nr:hypothetical protein Bca52824_034753 [Brassica carinata]
MRRSHLMRLDHLVSLISQCESIVRDEELFDGHNGSAAAKGNLLNNVLAAIPSDLNRYEWVAALPRTMIAGFVKTDKDFQERDISSV